jgi:hypothetical protein
MNEQATEERIIAYVDGELGPIEALRFERAMEEDPGLAEQVAKHRALRERIAEHFAPVVHEPLPERLTGMLDRGPNVIVFPARKPAIRMPAYRRWGAIAATLAVGVIAGQMIPRTGGPAITEHDGAIVAQAGLAHALDTQLASAGPGSGYVMGVSFRNKSGNYCRTFADEKATGIGCRQNDRWQLQLLIANESHGAATDYRQAGSANPAILQVVQDMAAGAPLDAAQEKDARDRGWK